MLTHCSIFLSSTIAAS